MDNTGESECVSLDVMGFFFFFTFILLYRKTIFRNPFHSRHKELIFIIAYFLLHSPSYCVLHILFLEVATENHSLKQVFSRTKQNTLKVVGYKPSNFVKLNSLRLNFRNF